MALERPVKVWGVEQHTHGGLPVSRALGWPHEHRVDVSAETFLSRFVAAARKEWFERGHLVPALRAFGELVPEATSMTVDFPAQRGDPGSPGRGAMQLRFDVVICTLPTVDVTAGAATGPGPGVFALVPLTGTGGFGADRASALAALERRIRMEAGVGRWLEDAAELWPRQVGAGVELVSLTDSVTLHTFNEVRERQKAKEEPVLPRFAQQMSSTGRAWLREPEVTETLRVLLAPHPSCLLLVGPSNAGRTAVFHEALRRAARSVVATNASRMVLALTRAGGWQEALARACEELAAGKQWLWVDHIADLFEVGRYTGNSMSMAEFLRPWLTSGQVRLAGEASPEEVARIEARAPGWLEAFTRVRVNEPSDPLPVVEAWAEACHGATKTNPARVAPGAAAEALRLGRRFSPYAGYPGKTIRFLDARAAGRPVAEGPVDRDVVVRGLCAESGLPRMMVDGAVPLDAATIEAWFSERVFGQPDAIRAVVETLSAVKADLSPRGRPIASMLLVGPTGVGKTETARALAGFLFSDASRMTRFDMSEYSGPHAVLRLCGIGDEEGQLTGAIRRQPFSVLLFDEVEKAHPSFLDLLLQLLGEGRLTDGRGRVADACACLVLLTSNVGAAEARRTPTGFDRGAEEAQRVDRSLQQAVSAWLRPELQNRLDRVLLYRPLGPEAVGRVLDRELLALSRRSGLRDLAFSVEPGAREWLITKGISPGYGARPLQRALHDALVAPLSRELAAWRRPAPPNVQVALTHAGTRIRVTLSEGTRAHTEDPHAYVAIERLLDTVRTLSRTHTFQDMLLEAPRAKRRRELRAVRVPAVEEAVVARVEEVRADLERHLVEEGARWLLDQAAVMSDGGLDELEERLLGAVRAVTDFAYPKERDVFLGFYGPDVDLCRRLAAVYADASGKLGLRVTARTLYRQPGSAPAFEAVTSDQKAPDAWLEAGVELEFAGPAAGALLTPEELLYEVRIDKRAVRLRVVYYGSEEDLKSLRSPGMVRKAWYDGKPDRDWPGAASFTEATAELRSRRALVQRLLRFCR